MAVRLTTLQAEMLRAAVDCLLDGDLEGATSRVNHVAFYPTMRGEDDFSLFVQRLQAYVAKLRGVFRPC